MIDLVEFMARGLVEHPEEVRVEEEDDRDRIVFYLRVADGDMGKVIGKEGRIANAMRNLLKVAATRTNTRVSLEIGD
jgi:predicted RNA-binding protein YlqC (UPF0109 family)